MYSKKRPVIISYNKLSNGSKLILTNAETYSELMSAIRQDSDFASADLTSLVLQHKGVKNFESIPFLNNGYTEAQWADVKAKSENRIHTPNGDAYNDESNDWVFVSLMESDKVYTSGLPENFMNLPKRALEASIKEDKLDNEFMAKFGYLPAVASKDEIISFLIDKRREIFVAKRTPADKTKQQLAEENGMLKQRIADLESKLNSVSNCEAFRNPFTGRKSSPILIED